METPEADAIEQELPPTTEQTAPVLGVEVPEADAVEQTQVVTPVESRIVRPVRDDVPEADAWEQAFEVETDDDYDR